MNYPSYQHGYLFNLFVSASIKQATTFFFLVLPRTEGAVTNHLVTSIIRYSNERSPRQRKFNAQVDPVVLV